MLDTERVRQDAQAPARATAERDEALIAEARRLCAAVREQVAISRALRAARRPRHQWWRDASRGW
jgi:hypothetical protein